MDNPTIPPDFLARAIDFKEGEWQDAADLAALLEDVYSLGVHTGTYFGWGMEQERHSKRSDYPSDIFNFGGTDG